MFSHREFEAALQKARNDHPNISDALGESIMKKFVERWENNRSKPKFEQVTFGELIRLTLNELHISGKNNRQMYAAVVGHYYSSHTTYSKARKKASEPPKTKAQPARKPFGVIIAQNGQLSWQL